MATADTAYVALLVIWLCVDRLVLWPMFLRRSEAEPARARVWLWSSGIILLWAMFAGCLAVWIFERRDWGELRLVAPHGWRIPATIGLLLIVALFYAPTIQKIRRAQRSNKRIRFPEEVARRSPHTRVELAWWLAQSLAAGISEELIFRGYVIWLFQLFVGPWSAAALSLLIFAVGHSYQGAKGVLRVGMVGGVFTLIVIVFGSLVPAMAVHVLVDAGEGLVAWLALRDVRTKGGGSKLGESLAAQ